MFRSERGATAGRTRDQRLREFASRICCWSAFVASLGLAAGPLPATALTADTTPPSQPPASTDAVAAPQDVLPTGFEWAEGQHAEVNGIELYRGIGLGVPECLGGRIEERHTAFGQQESHRTPRTR